ncbi:MAG: gliding motility-associated C-terminal domain-containing protein [Bacteroidetes bacterium]|nr:gliding motility-associated C-terminal domain-containing protein [Bacteroidota bacterium]
MKKISLFLLGLLAFMAGQISAQNRYWVGGTGSWQETSHWSFTSGGPGGASVPTATDDVIFDQHSFVAPGQTVMMNGNFACHSIDWMGIDKQVIFSAAKNKKLTVHGNYQLSPLLLNGFKGTTVFASNLSSNVINTNGVTLKGDWEFNGSGSWILQNDVLTEDEVTIKLLKGTLNTNSKNITCGYFTGNSNQNRTLNLGSSEITVKNIWDFSQATNLTFISATSRIIFETDVTSTNFKSGNLSYNSVSAIAAPCSPSNQPCGTFTITLSATNVTCNGLNNGTASAVVTGGSGNFSYDWSPGTPSGDGTPNITGLGASNMTVRVTDLTSGLFCFCNINVLEPGLLFDYELFQIQPLCNGQSNGTIAVDATGGTFPYTYSWTGGLGNNDTVTSVPAGTYTVTVTDVNNCSAFTVITLGQPTVLTTPGTATMVVCNGACDGTATVNASGGTAPYTYDWTPGAPVGDGTNAVTNLCPGNYTVTVTDFNGCIATYDTTITEPPLLTLTMSQTNASCGGVCDGTATATVSGGVTPYVYVWSNGSSTSTNSTTNTISNLCAGSYTLQITDANGCSRTDSVTITEPPILLASATGTNISCNAACDGTATAVVAGGTPGYSFNWTPGNPVGDGTANITNLCPGTYTVLVTDLNGCTDTGSVTITEPAVLIANPTSTNVLCFGACNGTATASPTGGTAPYSYNWTPGNPAGDGTPNISGLCAGTYSVTVTDANGCVSTQTTVVSQPTQIQANVTKTDVTCNGACNGTATASPTGGTPGYNYLWMPGGQTGQTATGLCPGTYTVTVTDANGCTRTSTTTITQPNGLNVTATGTALACNGDCNAIANAVISGGTPGYTIDWTPGNPSGDGTTTITALCAGTYTVTVTDANGCPATANTTINQPTLLVLNANASDASCFGVCDGSASAIGGGGTPPYTFSWAPGGQTTSTITNLCDGTYTVTIRDANNCTQTATVTVNEPTQIVPNASVANNITCSGLCNGSATSAVTGGTAPYTLNWNPGNPTGDGTPTITNLCAGTYTLQVTDANTCSTSQTVTITQPTPLSAPITGSTSSCNICNGTATVTPAGGTGPYTFLWMPTGQTTQTATGLCPNITYTVTVTDANNCTASNSVTIQQTIIINITTSNTTLSCAGVCDGIATANASGGAIPYSFLWVDNVGVVSVTQTATGLCAGTYSVTVSDANGCFNTDSVTFTNPTALTITTNNTNASCGGACDGTAGVTPAGGTGAYTYLWLPGGQTTQNVTGLCAGSYTVQVSDGNACTSTATIVITEPSQVLDNVTVTGANCTFADGSITVAPTGGTLPYSFNWGPGNPTGDGTATITNLLPGAYTLSITDGGGCVFNFNYILSNTAGPTTLISHTNVSCNNSCDGTVSVVPSGGAGGYLFDWTPGAPSGDGTAAISSLCGTITYTVQVTDAVGCITFDTATVFNPSLISVNETVVNESCGGVCDGSILLAPTGGTGAFTFAWLPGGQTTSSITGLCAGTYTATVTDVNGCDTTVTFTITSPPVLTVSLSSTDVLCNSACDGTATAIAAGGTPGYNYSWSHGAAFVLPNVVNLCPGQYILTVTDNLGCTAADTVNITEPTPLTSSTTQTNVSCNAVCDGEAVVIPSGGTLPYSFSWAPGGSTNDTASSLCAGVYNVTVTDGNGCTNSPGSVTITEPAPIIANAIGTNPSCNGSCNGSATANPSGGTAPYTFLWMPGGQITQTAIALCAGDYTVTVTDAQGCNTTGNVTLTDPVSLSSNTSSVSPSCANGCNGSVTANPVGGTSAYTFLWLPMNVNTQTVTNLCPGTYTVVTTDANSCVDTQSVVLNNAAAIDAVIGSTPAACGVCDGSISITPTTGASPYTFTWNPTPGAGNGTANGTAMCAGLYNITVTDNNGCDSTFVVPLNNSSGPTGETVTTTDATCNTFCDGTGSIIPIGGVSPFTYLWNDGPPATADSAAINLCAGNYLVQVTDANACIHFSPVTINEPAPIIDNAVITSAVCSTVCTGTITVAPTGGTAGYTFSWAPGNPTGQGTASVSNLCPGTYTLTITDANLCVQTFTYVIGQTTPLTATTSTTNILCSSACDGVATLNITSGTAPFNIQWNDPLGQTNDTASALCAGIYDVTITDNLGCSITLSDTITATPAVSANAIITDATCGQCNGQAALAPTGGTAPYTFVWSNGQTTATATNLCAGLYTVDITDANGCTTNFTIPVNNPTGPTSLNVTSTNVTCNGACDGAVTAIAPVGGTAPYTFLWVQTGQTAATANNLCAGNYFVQVTDANGCSIVDTIIITEPSAITANPTLTAATCGVCDGSISIAPSGGTAPYTVLWNTGSTALTLNNLCAGVYSVTITDATGCSINITIPLNNQNGPTLATTGTDITCNGSCNGTATVTATGGTSPYAFLWNDPAAQTTATASALCEGIYFVQVTDNAGCISISNITITEPDSIEFSLASSVNPLCNGNNNGVITTIPNGGTLPYTFAWSSGGNTATEDSLAAGSYTVTITDANGCTATQTITLTNPTSLTITSTSTNPSCNTIADGAIDVTVGGGTTPYSYQWSGASTANTEDLTAILNGTYTITVTDLNGCSIADTIVLLPNQTVLANAGNDTTFCESGSITLNATSTNGVNFQWFELPGNTSVGNTSTVSITPISGNSSYYVVVDNGAGCSINDTINLTSNPLPSVNAGADATIVVGTSIGIGGSPTTNATGATITWTPTTTLNNSSIANPTATPSTTTTYTVVVTSAQGCSTSDSVTITVRPTIIFPDGISPNGDGANDTWIIDGIELFPNCNVEVYNRWGELLFQSPGYKENWDGTYKGQPLPVGTYYYVIDLGDPLFPDAYTGPITIMR